MFSSDRQRQHASLNLPPFPLSRTFKICYNSGGEEAELSQSGYTGRSGGGVGGGGCAGDPERGEIKYEEEASTRQPHTANNGCF